MVKRIKVLLLALCAALLFSFAAGAAVSGAQEQAANTLKVLGLFLGTQNGMELERAPTRAEALVMLIRLLGEEEEALASRESHPFTDVPSWADRYVAYAYARGYANGVGETAFGAGETAACEHYLTFVLRALGYSDRDGDFVWNAPFAPAERAGISLQEIAQTDFRRGDAALISLRSLNALCKNGGTLGGLLVEKGALRAETMTRYHVPGIVPACLTDGSVTREGNRFFIGSASQIEPLLDYLAVSEPGEYILSGEGETAAALRSLTGREHVYKAVILEKWFLYDTGRVEAQLRVCNTLGGELRLLALGQSDGVSEEAALLYPSVRAVLDACISAGMSDYEKEKAVHDYLVLNTAYDYENYQNGTLPDISFRAAGVFLYRTAVCQGYAEAFQLLLNLIGIECYTVTGTSGGVSHAWNIVRLDGEYYHVDVTHDDPVPDAPGEVRHHYFNVTDRELSATHDRQTHPEIVCDGEKYNYYTYHRLTADDLLQLEELLTRQLGENRERIEVKLRFSIPESALFDLFGKLLLARGYSGGFSAAADRQKGIYTFYHYQ